MKNPGSVRVPPLLLVLASLAAAVAVLPPATAEVRNPDGAAVIIGNRDYRDRDVPPVAYAHRDAEAFKRYVLDVLGYAPGNVFELRDADRAAMFKALGRRGGKMSDLWAVLARLPEGGDVVVYYSGHGVPGREGGKGYLLPVNVAPRAAQEDGYPLDLLYEKLGSLDKARSVRVFLDACFSGGSHAGFLVQGASPVAMSAAMPAEASDKVTVLTAAEGSQLASWDEDSEHGLFTHHLLDALYGKGDGKGVGNGDGKVTASEAKAYLDAHMSSAAWLSHGREQQAVLLKAAGAEVVLSSAGGGGFPARPVLGETGGPDPEDEIVPPPVDLHLAAKSGDIVGLQAALAAGADVDARDGRGRTALMHAVSQGYPLLVEPLLSAGAQVDLRAPDGATALYTAAEQGHSEIIGLLMGAGADPSVRGPKGRTGADAARASYGGLESARSNGEGAAVLALLSGRTLAQVEAEEAARREREEERKRLAASDASAFERAVASGTAAAYEGYLLSYPDGRQASEAKRRRAAAVLSEAKREESELGLTRGQRMLVQAGLGSLGHDVGAADGVFGRRTRSGIESYQREKGLSETGYLTAELSEVLQARGEEAAERERKADDEAFAGAKRQHTESGYRAYLDSCGVCGHESEAEDLLAEVTKPKVGERFRDCEGAWCPELVVVPSGSFNMGSPSWEAGRYDDEGPLHRVTIARPFAVGVYEVTFGEWDACVSAGGCRGHRPSDRGWGRGRRPVMNVSWNDAKGYVEWLSGETGEEYRLLSESEWEYVARSGTRGPFHTGATISTEQANYDGSYTYGSGRKGRYRKKTTPVGEFPPNGFGLHDVHGNVREWVEDCWNRSYRGAPPDGSAWESGNCGVRVLRGGSWGSHPKFLRSAVRSWNAFGNQSSNVGFRVARTLAP